MKIDLDKKSYAITFKVIESEVMFVVLDTADEMDSILAEAGKSSPCEGGADGFCSANESGSRVTIVLNKEEISQYLIIHEITHAMLHVARYSSLDLTNKGDEELFCDKMGELFSIFINCVEEDGVFDDAGGGLQ